MRDISGSGDRGELLMLCPAAASRDFGSQSYTGPTMRDSLSSANHGEQQMFHPAAANKEPTSQAYEEPRNGDPGDGKPNALNSLAGISRKNNPASANSKATKSHMHSPKESTDPKHRESVEVDSSATSSSPQSRHSPKKSGGVRSARICAMLIALSLLNS